MRKSMNITPEVVERLESMGAKRWTKDDKDRLYLNKAAKELIGMEVSYYKTGNISSACIAEGGISNCAAYRILEAFKKTYIDLKTGDLHMQDIEEKVGDTIQVSISGLLIEALEKLIADTEKAEEAESIEDKEDAKMIKDTNKKITLKNLYDTAALYILEGTNEAVMIEWAFATGSATGCHNPFNSEALASHGTIGTDGEFEEDDYSTGNYETYTYEGPRGDDFDEIAYDADFEAWVNKSVKKLLGC